MGGSMGGGFNGQSMGGGALQVGSVDAKSTLLSVMKELGKTNKFIHKNDIYAVVNQQMEQSQFDGALAALAEDGAIYSTYDNDIFSITE